MLEIYIGTYIIAARNKYAVQNTGEHVRDRVKGGFQCGHALKGEARSAGRVSEPLRWLFFLFSSFFSVFFVRFASIRTVSDDSTADFRSPEFNRKR